MSTTISSPKTTLTREDSNSDANNSLVPPRRSNKRSRQENGVSRSNFKGVVAQANGNWGAQIYANHQRVWLGTFKSENEAASAYDSAAIRLRWGDAQKNFSWTNDTRQEPLFQSHYTTEAILQMIKDGSYSLKFADFLTSNKSPKEIKSTSHNGLINVNNRYVFQMLFQKELTPSDVGKLNRLVIPKKYASRYFSNVFEEENNENNEVDDTILTFLDTSMRTWRFRYCYWKRSQSCVLTRGWNRFVKENKLSEKDMVMFYKCECSDGHNKGNTFFMIRVTYSSSMTNNNESGIVDNSILELAYSGNEPSNIVDNIDGETKKKNETSNKVLEGKELKTNETSFRLFGVNISETKY
ncbi:AP2/ERF and B3 domain-containing transcription factor At1g50680-like [Impatiens glandulifera]|uniref:AP2/ERF and B3 domain-containing transcription factor At1g50680-like n=1 Tax=Impatiens glandulifera TaxID=253017 RepID=UPI001FB08F95|nr:AP2/ERF and B3 domain-containing transcription factor At1g50680-like [Impatiens glandulifera]